MPRTENLGLQLVDGADYLRKAVMGKPNENMGKLDSVLATLAKIAVLGYNRPFAFEIRRTSMVQKFDEKGASTFGCTVGGVYTEGTDFYTDNRGNSVRSNANVPLVFIIAQADVTIGQGERLYLSCGYDAVGETTVDSDGKATLFGFGKLGAQNPGIDVLKDPGDEGVSRLQNADIGVGGIRLMALGFFESEEDDRIAKVSIAFSGRRGASGIPEPFKAIANLPCTLPSDVPTNSNPNIVFKGWAAGHAAESADYQPGDSFVPSGDMVFYSVWETLS